MNQPYGRTGLLSPPDAERLTDDMPQVKTRSVLLVDPVSSGKYFVPVLEQLGLRTILVDTPSALAGGYARSVGLESLDFERDFSCDVFALRDYCLQRDMGYVLAGCESSIEVCKQLRSLLPRCPQNSLEQPSRRWDKFDMMNALADAGVPHLHTARLFDTDDFDNQADVFAKLSEMIVKPSRGAGSVDVQLVDSVDAARDAVAQMLARPGFVGDEVAALVQEYYAGDEYIVDTFSHQGKHDVISTCVYQKVLRGGAFVYERAVWIGPDHENFSALVDYSYRALDALGVENGSSHIEVMMGSKGPRLIDFGARAAGAGIPMLTFHLTGDSQIHTEAAYVKSICDSSAHHSYTGPGEYRLAKHGAVICFNIERAGTFIAGDAEGELRGIDGLVDATIAATHGRQYPATRTLIDSFDVGTAFVAADTAEELDRICAQVNRTVAGWFSYR
jgi:hypothetical protein